jgi:hypothetical protein
LLVAEAVGMTFLVVVAQEDFFILVAKIRKHRMAKR